MRRNLWKTITLENPGRFALTETANPGPLAAGEALVRVRRVGVSRTDMHAYRGKHPFFSYPRILGREISGEILEVNAVESGLKPGDKCSVEPYLNCGKCIACRRGRSNCCTTLKCLGVHTDGGMREMIRIPANKLHRSETLSLDQLALVETLGVGAHAVDRAQLEPGETVLVIGAGPIGLSVLQFAQLANVKLMVMDVSAARLEFCKRQFRIDKSILCSSIEKAFEELKAATNNELPTAVFDATGNVNSMTNSFRYTAHSGRLIYVGLVLGEITFNDPDFHRREMTLLATRNSTPADFQRIIGMMEAGQVHTSPWITHRATVDTMIGQF